MIDLNNLPPDLKLFLDHTVKPLIPSIKTKVLAELANTSTSMEHLKAILNLLNGMNYKIFKKFVDENSENCTLENFEKSKINIAFGLNPEQIEACVHNHQKLGPLLILAGAGSGKTAVLTRRIIYLLMAGVCPENILSVTFTNKAAGEMKERIINITKEIFEQAEGEFKEKLKEIMDKIPDMWVSTFHSSCLRLLYDDCLGKKNFKRIGFETRPDIIPTLAQKSIFEKLYEKANIKDAELEDVISKIDEAKNELYTVDYFKSNAKGKLGKKIAFIYENYQVELKKREQVDFNDIIMGVAEIFENYPDVLEFYRNKFQYILVDEYQDTNFAQYFLIYKLAEKHKRLFVVGDDDQSIYGWRGADIRNILNFKKDFENAFVVKFERNYRSSQTILNAANSVFVNKPAELRKVLKVTKRDVTGKVFQGERIILFEAETDVDEVKYCVYEIKNILKEKEKNYEINKLKYFENNYQYFQAFIEKFYEFLNSISELNLFDLSKKGESIYLNIYTNYSILINEFQNDGKLKNETVLNFLDSINGVQDLISDKLNEEYNSFLHELMRFINPYSVNFRKKVFKYKDFAIFYRINNQKNLVKEILTQEQIPFVEIGDTRFFEFREVINVLLYLEIIVSIYKYLNNDNTIDIRKDINEKFVELICLPFYRFLSTDKTLIEHQAPNKAIVEEEEMEKMRNRLSINAKSGFNFVMSCFEKIYKLDETAPLVNIFYIVLEALMYKEKYDDEVQRSSALVKNLFHLKDLIQDFDNTQVIQKNIFKRLEEFVSDLKAKQSDPQCQLLKNDGVNLMTLHSAKGLEFPIVFFIGVEENICPHKHPGTELSALKEEERIDEERRLFYVGITRAQERLYITYCMKRTWYGKTVFHKPSRFLAALPKETVECGKSNKSIFKNIYIILRRWWSIII